MVRILIIFISMALVQMAFAKSPPPKGILPELQLNKKSETENLKTAAEAEALISKSEEQAIKQLETLLKKYKGTQQEPDLLFRLAELYTRRAKTGRFVDLYRGEKTLAEILSPKLTEKGAKAYLAQSITNYRSILKSFPNYPAMDEVLFNLAFAHEQRGESDEALNTFLVILEKHPDSALLPEAHMALGELFFQKQNYQESQKHYDKVQEWPNTPIAPIALYKSAWCSYNLKSTPEAVRKMEKLLEQSRTRPLVSHVRSEAKRDLALFYSEVGAPDLAISYFAKHLLENEIGPTVLELSSIYERHGKLNEMDLVLALFLKTYPEDSSSGSIHSRRIQHLNEQHKNNLVIESLREASKLCKNEKWRNKQKETLSFCTEAYPAQIKDLVAEWWENWNKLKRPKDGIADLNFVFNEYLGYEPENSWDVAIHMSFADFLFMQNEFAKAAYHYEGVSKTEKLEPETLHNSLYGAVICLDRVLQNNAKDPAVRSQLLLALNNYITQCPKGEYIDETKYKKAFLFYEEKDYIQSLEWLGKINAQNLQLKEKREDLTLEIHRSKKDFEALVKESLAILKVSTGERQKKIKLVYQTAQQSIIQQLVEKEKLSEAADKAKAFYDEHTPEPQALDALHLAIELWEKMKKYRLAAENAEILALEFKKINKTTEAEQLVAHSIQLFLQLGDLARAQKSLTLSLDYFTEASKKRESLELLAEIASWYGDVNTTEKTWQLLEAQMTSEEKQALLHKRLHFFEKQAPEKAQKLKEGLIAKGVEPFFSEHQIQIVSKLCQDKKWTPCYQMALKLNRDITPPKQRAVARYLQSKVLINEYNQQSLKASGERLALVMAYKAEKFDKAVQILNTVSQKSETLELRHQGVIDLISLYTDYVNQLKKSVEGLNSGIPEQASLKQEIEQILPVLAQRPKELEPVLAELEKMMIESKETEKMQVATIFPELKGTELRIYVPTWQETNLFRPLNDIKVSAQSCSLANIQTLTTQSALSQEATACLSKGQFKILETAALRLSDLYPDSHWGPFYLALSASQQHSMERALWYLKLAQKRSKESLLSYEEARQSYLQRPDQSVLIYLKKLEGAWALIEENSFVRTLDAVAQGQCEGALKSLKELRQQFWQSTPIQKMVMEKCPNSPTRNLSSTELTQ